MRIFRGIHKHRIRGIQYIIYSDVYFIPQSCHPFHEPCYLHPSHFQVFLLTPEKINIDCANHKKI